jgi:hypothetical protein
MFYYIMVVKWFYGSEYASVANHIYYVEWCGKTAPYMLTCYCEAAFTEAQRPYYSYKESPINNSFVEIASSQSSLLATVMKVKP